MRERNKTKKKKAEKKKGGRDKEEGQEEGKALKEEQVEKVILDRLLST